MTLTPPLTGCGLMAVVWFIQAGPEPWVNPMTRAQTVGVTVTTWSGPGGNGWTEQRWKKMVTFASTIPLLGERKGTPKYPRELLTKSFKVIVRNKEKREKVNQLNQLKVL